MTKMSGNMVGLGFGVGLEGSKFVCCNKPINWGYCSWVMLALELLREPYVPVFLTFYVSATLEAFVDVCLLVKLGGNPCLR